MSLGGSMAQIVLANYEQRLRWARRAMLALIALAVASAVDVLSQARTLFRTESEVAVAIRVYAERLPSLVDDFLARQAPECRDRQILTFPRGPSRGPSPRCFVSESE